MTFGTDLLIAGATALLKPAPRRDGASLPAHKGLPFALSSDPIEQQDSQARAGFGRFDYRLKVGQVSVFQFVGDWLMIDPTASCGAVRVQLDTSGQMNALASVVLRPGESIRAPFNGISLAPVGNAAGRVLLARGAVPYVGSQPMAYQNQQDPFGSLSSVVMGTGNWSSNVGTINTVLVSSTTNRKGIGLKNLILEVVAYSNISYPMPSPSGFLLDVNSTSEGAALLTPECLGTERWPVGADKWIAQRWRWPDLCIVSDTLDAGGVRLILTTNGFTGTAESMLAYADIYNFL